MDVQFCSKPSLDWVVQSALKCSKGSPKKPKRGPKLPQGGEKEVHSQPKERNESQNNTHPDKTAAQKPIAANTPKDLALDFVRKILTN